MQIKKCSHGVVWDEECSACDVIWWQETSEWHKKAYDDARVRLARAQKDLRKKQEQQS